METAGPCTTTLAVGDDGVAVITLDHPPVNALHTDVLTSLVEHLHQAQQRIDVKAIIVAGSGAAFSAGFDIRLLAAPGGVGPLIAARRPQLVAALADLAEGGAKPTVAAIHRVALGGGLEIAMACNARLATPDSSLGLPETRLGIVPGLGGTQRLPRLVGLPLALDLMVSGRALKAPEAEAAGLIDGIVPADGLLAAARQAALDMAAGRQPCRRTLELSDRLGSLAEAATAVAAARRRAAVQHPGQRHYQLCLDAVQAGVEQGPEQGAAVEGRAFSEATSLALHRALVRAFLAHKAASKARGISRVLLQLQALLALVAVLLLRLWAAATAAAGLAGGSTARAARSKAE